MAARRGRARGAQGRAMNMMTGHISTRRGFTLIEMLAATCVTAIISSMAAMLMVEASRVRTAATIRADLTDNAARGVEQILRYVREIPQDAGLTGKAQIGAADASTLTFGLIGFRKNGAVVEMTINNGTTWRAMCRDTSSLTFRYYRADGTELTVTPLSPADREAVRQVSVELQLSRGNEGGKVRSRVYLRSFLNEAAG